MEGGGPAALYGEQSTDNPVLMNMVLSNGARLYVDHAHPEYSSPEVTTPRDAVLWDKAGDAVVLAAMRHIASAPGFSPVNLYKNNTDSKGASYGSHENYLVPRSVPFANLVQGLVPFFASRQVIVGSGRVGIGTSNQRQGYQLSQRADFFEAEVGLETTIRRPIVNTRDEPHADRSRWRRLHLIIGDANLFETATYLKLGTTSAVLWVLEHLDDLPGVQTTLAGLRLHDPVAAVSQVSRDLALTRELELADGRRMTAVALQQAYLDVVRDAVAVLGPGDTVTDDVLARWGSVLDRLVTDRASCARDVEWVAKLRLLEGLRSRDGLAWDHPRLRAMDLQWSDVRPERSIYQRLVTAGAVERLVTEESVAEAVAHPPTDTRAYFRGEVMARFPAAVSAASWDSVIFDLPGAPSLQRVPMMDPWRGSEQHVGRLFAESPDAETFLAALLG